MVRRGVVLSAALMCSSGLCAQNMTRLDAVAGVPEIDKTTQTQDIQFRNTSNDRMTVSVRLAGTGPYQFLVDTGADRSAVSSAIVAKLALARGSAAALHSSTGVTRVMTARVPNLELTRPTQKL